MEKTLIDLFFDNRFSNYDIFMSDKRAILIHKNTLNVLILTEEEYLKVYK